MTKRTGDSSVRVLPWVQSSVLKKERKRKSKGLRKEELTVEMEKRRYTFKVHILEIKSIQLVENMRYIIRKRT